MPACGRVIRKARERGIPVFFVNRIYRRNGSDVEFTRYDSWLGGNRYLAPNSTGAVIYRGACGIYTAEGGLYNYKASFFRFFPDRAGFNSAPSGRENCDSDRKQPPRTALRTSCYDGLSLDYNILIIEDCCSSNTAEIQRVNMEDMAMVGAVITDSDTFCTDVFAVADFAGEIQRRVQQDETAPE